MCLRAIDGRGPEEMAIWIIVAAARSFEVRLIGNGIIGPAGLQVMTKHRVGSW